MSPQEVIQMAQAFNRAKKPIGVITQYLESRIRNIGSKLSDMEALSNKPNAGQYALTLLAEQTAYLGLLNLLSEFDVDQTEE